MEATSTLGAILLLFAGRLGFDRARGRKRGSDIREYRGSPGRQESEPVQLRATMLRLVQVVFGFVVVIDSRR